MTTHPYCKSTAGTCPTIILSFTFLGRPGPESYTALSPELPSPDLHQKQIEQPSEELFLLFLTNGMDHG